jgi:hypothetical protein
MLDLTHNGFLWMTGLASFHHVEWAVCKNISHVMKCAQCYPLQLDIDEALQKSSLSEIT